MLKVGISHFNYYSVRPEYGAETEKASKWIFKVLDEADKKGLADEKIENETATIRNDYLKHVRAMSYLRNMLNTSSQIKDGK